MSSVLAITGFPHVAGIVRVVCALAGAFSIFAFFKSIIRVGVLNRHYHDPLAFWVARLVFVAFRLRITKVPGGGARKNEIMTWYWPCALIGVICSWFVLVTFGFALLNIAFRAEGGITAAAISSGSALSTLGFSTPTTVPGEFLAIFEGAMGFSWSCICSRSFPDSWISSTKLMCGGCRNFWAFV